MEIRKASLKTIMKIYIQQDNQKAGPFTRDELQDKIYSGELSRTNSACLENSPEWVPLESLLNTNLAPAKSAPSGLEFNLQQLKDPKEKTALIWLYIASIPAWIGLLIWIVISFGFVLILIGIFELIYLMGRFWFAAHLKTNAVRVSETQLPEVHRIVQGSCVKLGMEIPEVYVMQQNVWNAFATKVFGRGMVVLLSGAVDSILLKGDMQELSWLVGHELGHLWAGHLNMSQKFAKLGAWFIWVNLWHSRRAEFTCDRIGLYCAGSLKASQLAVVNATVGAQLAGRVNIGEAMNQ